MSLQLNYDVISNHALTDIGELIWCHVLFEPVLMYRFNKTIIRYIPCTVR